MKKRYILSSFLSAICFLILYLILDFNLLICLPLTVGIFIGGVLIFKEKDVRHYDPNVIMHYCYLISKIANYGSQLEDKDIAKEIKDITDEAEKIIVMLEQKPNKVTQVYDSFDYYLPLCVKVIEQYVYLKKRDKLNAEEEKFMNNMKSFCDSLEIEIKKLLENMNYIKMLDINSSIEVFKNSNTLANSNLIVNDSKEDKE